ncbi:hypothetical protein SAMN05216548_1063 [Faunimonas pinastri]|uniref:Uncharacterized protein n=1 Tax=Faunimonas pinastri TaxID=1855383 RepID=A0A1H9HD25_9HYPH|nr:hypothetical protein [Faunimonas pinastri]SEQ60207.1 hypothetical protein SAMN05216548_1063 [Faunimonas pinastri]
MITGSEHSLTEWASVCGETQDAGEIARLFDVPALHPGCVTIFDWLEEEYGAEQGAKRAETRLANIRRRCMKYRGTVLPEFICYLMAQGTDFELQVRSLMAAFEAEVVREEMEPALKHAAKNFALIYAAGMLARDAGLVAWSEARIEASIRRCFEDGASIIQAQIESFEEARARFFGQLETDELIEHDADRSLFATARGYRTRSESSTPYILRGEAVLSWLPNPSVRNQLLLWAADEGLLRCKGKSTGGRDIAWAETQRGWRDGTRPRSIVLKVSRETLDALTST